MHIIFWIPYQLLCIGFICHLSSVFWGQLPQMIQIFNLHLRWHVKWYSKVYFLKSFSIKIYLIWPKRYMFNMLCTLQIEPWCYSKSSCVFQQKPITALKTRIKAGIFPPQKDYLSPTLQKTKKTKNKNKTMYYTSSCSSCWLKKFSSSEACKEISLEGM